MSYLRLREVAKSYDGETNAVDDVSIGCRARRVHHLPGPKRLRQDHHAADDRGIRDPTGGVIEPHGHDLTPSKPYERNIGMVFQNYALFPHMTAAKNVLFPLKMRHFPKATCRRASNRCSSSWAEAVSPTATRANCPAAQQQRRCAARPRVQPRRAAARRAARRASTRTCASRCRSRSSASIARSASP